MATDTLNDIQYTPGAVAGTEGFNPSYIQDSGDSGYTYNGVSEDPSLAIGGAEYTTPDAAKAAWFAANPAYAQFQDQSYAQGPNLTGQGGNAPGAQGPSWQPTPQQLAALAPPPLQAFGNLPQVSPTYANAAYVSAPTAPNAALVSPTYASAATVDPNQNLQYLQQYEGLEAQALEPQFQRQQQQLSDSLASRGITNSGSAEQLTNDLKAQQAATFAGAVSPFVSQEAGYTQADIAANQANRQQTRLTNAGASNAASGANAAAINSFMSQGYSYEQAAAMANQQAEQQVNLTNAATANQATGINASYYDQALTGNAAAYDQYLRDLYGAGVSTYGAELGAYTGSYVPNSGVTGIMGTGLGGTLNTYGNVYGSAAGGQGAALGGIGQGFGAYEGALAAAA